MHPSNHLTTTAATADRIDWRCHTCGQPTTAGGLHIDLASVREAEREWTAWRNRPARDPDMFSLAEVLTMPSPARWRVDCNSCLREQATTYTIDLAQCQSVWALIRWQAHLSEKNWFPATDWMTFVAEVARRHGSPSEPVGMR
jgi:hypothetical protein